MLEKNEAYREWRYIRLECNFDRAWRALVRASDVGYKTVLGAKEFQQDVGNFLFSSLLQPMNPHAWDKLLGRAKAHGCNKELRTLKERFGANQKLWAYEMQLASQREGQQDFTYQIKSEG